MNTARITLTQFITDNISNGMRFITDVDSAALFYQRIYAFLRWKTNLVLVAEMGIQQSEVTRKGSYGLEGSLLPLNISL